MLPKSKRFNLSDKSINWKAFRWTKLKGLSIGLSGYINPNTLVAVVITKKVSKSAVVRNKLKRQIYDLTNQVLDLNIPNRVIVIKIFPEIITLSYSQLKEIFETFKHKIKE